MTTGLLFDECWSDIELKADVSPLQQGGCLGGQGAVLGGTLGWRYIMWPHITRAANDPSVFIITEEASTRALPSLYVESD